MIVQECGAGLVRVRRTADGLAFAAPPLLREGPVDEIEVEHIAAVLRIERAEILDAAWADNGPGWVAVLLRDADAVLALKPGFVDLDLGVVGPYPEGSPEAFEVRAFMPEGRLDGRGSGHRQPERVGGAGGCSPPAARRAPYVARQGTVLGRAGRIHVSVDGDGAIWVAGGTVTCVDGAVELVGMTALFGIFPVPEAAQRERLVEQVLLADRLGLDLVGIQDHPYQRRFLDTWTLLSYLAGRTERIRLFPDVASLPLRSPALLAKAAASLDLLSGGRAELGLGAGAFWEAIGAWDGPVRTPSSPSTRSRRRSRSSAACGRASAGIRFEGEHYRLRGAHGGPEPAHDMGIWLGAYGPRMLRLVGQRRRRLGAEPAAAAAGRRAGAPGGDRRGGAGRRARPRGDRAGGERQRRDRRRRRSPAGCTGRWSTGSTSSTRLVTELRFDGLVLWPEHDDPLGQTERFATEVVPRVRSAIVA